MPLSGLAQGPSSRTFHCYTCPQGQRHQHDLRRAVRYRSTGNTHPRAPPLQELSLVAYRPPVENAVVDAHESRGPLWVLRVVVRLDVLRELLKAPIIGNVDCVDQSEII